MNTREHIDAQDLRNRITHPIPITNLIRPGLTIEVRGFGLAARTTLLGIARTRVHTSCMNDQGGDDGYDIILAI